MSRSRPPRTLHHDRPVAVALEYTGQGAPRVTAKGDGEVRPLSRRARPGRTAGISHELHAKWTRNKPRGPSRTNAGHGPGAPRAGEGSAPARTAQTPADARPSAAGCDTSS